MSVRRIYQIAYLSLMFKVKIVFVRKKSSTKHKDKLLSGRRYSPMSYLIAVN